MGKKEQDNDVVDAKGGSVAVVENKGAVAQAKVTVQGVSLKFPFIRVGQGLSQWRSNGKAPQLGCFYIGKDKTTNTFIADSGAENGFEGILLDVVMGVMEDKPFTGAANPPKRWVGPDAEAQAAKEGFDFSLRDTGEKWADSGRPKLRANLSRFCYLQMLVPATEDLNPAEYQLFPIGDRLWTPARIEFSKGAFKELNDSISSISRSEKFKHRKEPDYEFSWRGKLCRLWTKEAVSKQTGNPYPFLCFGLSDKEFTEEEKKDFTSFLMSVSSVEADMNGADDGEF